METRREKNQNKIYRTIAWIVSITLHLTLIYFLGQYSPEVTTDLNDLSEVLAKVE